MKSKFYPYEGDDPERILPGFCNLCKEQHVLPMNEWILVQKKKKFKLACRQSVKEKFGVDVMGKVIK